MKKNDLPRPRCIDCNYDWDFFSKTPKCYKDGHQHELDGRPIKYLDHEILSS